MYETKSLRNGVEIRDIADILRHSKIAAMANYYISQLKKNLKKQLENLKKVKSDSIDEIIKYE